MEGDGAPSLGPRPLALLAVVAAGPPGGVSRDRVIGILWPDTGEEQARHTLSQTLYNLRRAVGRDLITGTTQLRLDPTVTSDIGELRAAIQAGDLAQAAALHSAPFLQGFHLPGASEFERWTEEERGALHREVLRAIERLARHADESEPAAESVRWWQQLADRDPLSARYTIGLMHALDSAGDRSGALARARLYREVVQRELETEADPDVRKLEAELRAAPPLQAPAPASPGPPVAREPVVAAAPEQSRRIPSWLAPIALIGATGLALVLRNSDRGHALPFLAVGTIVVAEAGDSGSAGSVLRDMLATTFSGIEGLQVVANSRLEELTPASGPNDPGGTAGAARRAGATELIEGELAREPAGLVLTLRRVDLERGVVRRGYVLRARDRHALADSAAAAVARDLGLTPPALAVHDVRTTSGEAYALYTEGLRAYYRFDSPGAYRLMTAALERDSNFAMAAYYAWLIGRDVVDAETVQRAYERAKRLAPRTADRERLLIQASTAGTDAPASVRAAIAETLAVRYPTDPDGQIVLGEARTGQGDWGGSVAAFERAVTIDSAAGAGRGPHCRSCLALARMATAYIWWDSADAAVRTARRIVALRPDDPQEWSNLVEPLLRQGRRAEAEAAIERSREVVPVSQWNGLLDRDLLRWGHYQELEPRLLAAVQAPSQEVRSDGRWLLMLSLRDQGRLREGLALARESRIPGSTRTVVGLGLDPVFTGFLEMEMGHPDSGAALLHSEARRLLGATGMPPGLQARMSAWYLALAATVYASAGDTAVVRRLADSISVIGQGSPYGRDLIVHHYLNGLLLQHAGRHAEAVDELRRSIFSSTDGYSRANLALARSLLALRRPAEALAVLRPAIRGGVDGSNSYTSRTELHEAMAEAFEQAGQRDSAQAHWKTVESSWRRADPELAERYARAKKGAGSSEQGAGSRKP